MPSPESFQRELSKNSLSQAFELTDGRLVRKIKNRLGIETTSHVLLPEQNVDLQELEATYELAWLQSRSAPGLDDELGVIRIVDLFAGCGGLTLGIQEAGRALGLRLEVVLANDTDPAALNTYVSNWPEARAALGPVQELLDGDVGSALTDSERKLRRELGTINLAVGGPPCQGHSDLNNHTRRSDPKNELYFRMARFCEVIEPDHLIIENVPGVLHDRRGVAQRTWERLEELGYQIGTGVINAADVGVAQQRRRSVTLASRTLTPDLKAAISCFKTEPRPLEWAIGDLEYISDSSTDFDSAPNAKPESRRRINYLFDHELFDLPDSERPECHRLKEHTYTSMYGRMHGDKPAQTITTGFGVMGRGRYVHPTQRRTITPHEAARIQFFPDFFQFPEAGRTKLHMQIGNAVPPKLGFVLGMHLMA